MLSSPFVRPTMFADLPNIIAGFSTRHGGVSKPPFDTLNLGGYTDDDPASVAENRRRWLSRFGLWPDRLATPRQVHGSKVVSVDEPGEVPACDGLVTATPDLPLGLMAADCAVVLLADPVQGIIGACHSGWRGTVRRIAAETVRRMQHLGADPESVRAYIGPCLSTARFEVGPEVAAQFDPAFVVRKAGWPKPHLDMKGAIRAQLVEAGLPWQSIEVSDACTVSEPTRFFSHRADAGRTGRMMGLIALREAGAAQPLTPDAQGGTELG